MYLNMSPLDSGLREPFHLGISPTGLKKFLEGTKPDAPTRRLLRRWLAERGDPVQIGPEAHVIPVALDVLFRELPHDVAATWREKAYQGLEAGYGIPITRVSARSVGSMLLDAGTVLEGAARRVFEQHVRRSSTLPPARASAWLPSVLQGAPGAWLIVLLDHTPADRNRVFVRDTGAFYCCGMVECSRGESVLTPRRKGFCLSGVIHAAREVAGKAVEQRPESRPEPMTVPDAR
jgi:hypothetical protein